MHDLCSFHLRPPPPHICYLSLWQRHTLLLVSRSVGFPVTRWCFAPVQLAVAMQCTASPCSLERATVSGLRTSPPLLKPHPRTDATNVAAHWHLCLCVCLWEWLCMCMYVSECVCVCVCVSQLQNGINQNHPVRIWKNLAITHSGIQLAVWINPTFWYQILTMPALPECALYSCGATQSFGGEGALVRLDVECCSNEMGL